VRTGLKGLQGDRRGGAAGRAVIIEERGQLIFKKRIESCRKSRKERNKHLRSSNQEKSYEGKGFL